MFVVWCLLLVDGVCLVACCLFVVGFVVGYVWLLFSVCCALFLVCCLLFVVGCSFVVVCWFVVVRCVLFVVRCLWCVVRVVVLFVCSFVC